MEAVTLSALVDDVFGDLLDAANPAVTANTCPAQPAVIPVGGTFSCSFDAFVAGDAGDPDHVNTATGGRDDDGNRAAAQDDAVVAFDDVLPPSRRQDAVRRGRCRSRGPPWRSLSRWPTPRWSR